MDKEETRLMELDQEFFDKRLSDLINAAADLGWVVSFRNGVAVCGSRQLVDRVEKVLKDKTAWPV